MALSRKKLSLIDQALGTDMHATRTNIHTTFKGAPGALVFERDMFLDAPLKLQIGKQFNYIRKQQSMNALEKPT